MNFKCTYFDVVLVHFCALGREDKDSNRVSGSFLFFKIPKGGDRTLRLNLVGETGLSCFFANVSDHDNGTVFHSH